ncbi:type 1 glutamine amidotransferase domain-containing protein [Dyadobacter tibetensis]|uniref:type 1 glutamine amidotransferase domain-containing protein n=1 Tax=Dyadobacter tibetensis TaxID=1211851 RepID=UPI0004728A08|nr:type 1 glutamine amidotransferase domain-containing protein [Dyadobacter tibetensis]
MKALIVCTNYGHYPKRSASTGIWFNQLTHFYHIFNKRKILLDIVSPQGGAVPVDPRSLEIKDELNTQYLGDVSWMQMLQNTRSPDQIDASEYRLVYFVGGPGAMFDFPAHETLAAIAKIIYDNGGFITAVGHGVAALLAIKLTDGSPFVRDKYVTGFTNLEEKLVSFMSDAPFSLEDTLKEKGAHFTKAMLPFLEFIEMDERLITGQNGQSARKVASKAVEELFEK